MKHLGTFFSSCLHFLLNWFVPLQKRVSWRPPVHHPCAPQWLAPFCRIAPHPVRPRAPAAQNLVLFQGTQGNIHVLAWPLFFPSLIIVLSVRGRGEGGRMGGGCQMMKPGNTHKPLRCKEQLGSVMFRMTQTWACLGNTSNITKQR